MTECGVQTAPQWRPFRRIVNQSSSWEPRVLCLMRKIGTHRWYKKYGSLQLCHTVILSAAPAHSSDAIMKKLHRPTGAGQSRLSQPGSVHSSTWMLACASVGSGKVFPPARVHKAHA